MNYTAINKNIKTMRRLMLFCCLMTSSLSAYSEIYKWKDENGRTHFSDRPPEGQKVIEVKLKIISYTNTSVVSTPISFSNKFNDNEQVIMYSTAWCPTCRKAKAYFKEKGIEFEEYDVETSEKGKEDFKELGGTGVPIILVGGKRLNGFNKYAFDAIYSR